MLNLPSYWQDCTICIYVYQTMHDISCVWILHYMYHHWAYCRNWIHTLCIHMFCSIRLRLSMYLSYPISYTVILIYHIVRIIVSMACTKDQVFMSYIANHEVHDAMLGLLLDLVYLSHTCVIYKSISPTLFIRHCVSYMKYLQLDTLKSRCYAVSYYGTHCWTSCWNDIHIFYIPCCISFVAMYPTFCILTG